MLLLKHKYAIFLLTPSRERSQNFSISIQLAPRTNSQIFYKCLKRERERQKGRLYSINVSFFSQQFFFLKKVSIFLCQREKQRQTDRNAYPTREKGSSMHCFTLQIALMAKAGPGLFSSQKLRQGLPLVRQGPNTCFSQAIPRELGPKWSSCHRHGHLHTMLALQVMILLAIPEFIVHKKQIKAPPSDLLNHFLSIKQHRVLPILRLSDSETKSNLNQTSQISNRNADKREG